MSSIVRNKNIDNWIMTNKSQELLMIYVKNKKGKWKVVEFLFNKSGFIGENIIKVFNYATTKYGNDVRILNKNYRLIYSSRINRLHDMAVNGIDGIKMNDYNFISVRVPDKKDECRFCENKAEYLRNRIKSYSYVNNTFVKHVQLIPVKFEEDEEKDERIKCIKITFDNGAIMKALFTMTHP